MSTAVGWPDWQSGVQGRPVSPVNDSQNLAPNRTQFYTIGWVSTWRSLIVDMDAAVGSGQLEVFQQYSPSSPVQFYQETFEVPNGVRCRLIVPATAAEVSLQVNADSVAGLNYTLVATPSQITVPAPRSYEPPAFVQAQNQAVPPLQNSILTLPRLAPGPFSVTWKTEDGTATMTPQIIATDHTGAVTAYLWDPGTTAGPVSYSGILPASPVILRTTNLDGGTTHQYQAALTYT